MPRQPKVTPASPVKDRRKAALEMTVQRGKYQVELAEKRAREHDLAYIPPLTQTAEVRSRNLAIVRRRIAVLLQRINGLDTQINRLFGVK